MSTTMILYAMPMVMSLAGALLCIIPALYFDEIVSVVAASAAVVFAGYAFALPDATGGLLYVDGLSKIMTLTVAVIHLGAIVYSITYLKHIENRLFQRRFYYFLLNAFAFTMLFTVSANNLGFIWVGIEATTVTSALLVATENDDSAIEAAWRYIIIVSSGLVISLVAVVFLYAAGKTLVLSTYLRLGETGHLFSVGVLLTLVGYGTKAGIFPLSSWLPDVHGRAPSPVSAVFSGVLLPVAMYGIIRSVGLSSGHSIRLFLLVFGILTAGSAALLLYRQEDYKRMYAYSTAENMGIILIGLACGRIGLLGAIVVLVSHAFAKAAVFFLTGNLLARYRSTRIADVSAVARRMPRTGYALFFASLAVTGAPPFGVFLGELLVLSALYAHFGLAVTLLVAAFLLVAFISINRRVVTMVFSGEGGEPMERGRVGTIVPIVNVALSLVAIGFVPLIAKLLEGVR